MNILLAEVTNQELFYTTGVVFMITILVLIVVMLIATLVGIRKLRKKINEVKALPRRGKNFVQAFFGAFFR